METISTLRKTEKITSDDATKLLENGITEVSEKNKDTVEKLLGKDITKTNKGSEEKMESTTKEVDNNVLFDMLDKGVINSNQYDSLHNANTEKLKDVKEVKGIGPKTFAGIKSYLNSNKNSNKSSKKEEQSSEEQSAESKDEKIARLEQRLNRLEERATNQSAPRKSRGGEKEYDVLTNRAGNDYGVQFNRITGTYSDKVKRLKVNRSKEDRREYTSHYGSFVGKKKTIHFTVYSNDMISFRTPKGKALKLSDKVFVKTAEMIMAHVEKAEEILS